MIHTPLIFKFFIAQFLRNDLITVCWKGIQCSDPSKCFRKIFFSFNQFEIIKIRINFFYYYLLKCNNFFASWSFFVNCISLKRRPFQLRNNCSWRFKPWLWLWSDECVIVQKENVLRCLQCLLKFQNMKFFIFSFFHLFVCSFVHLLICLCVRVFICSYVLVFSVTFEGSWRK